MKRILLPFLILCLVVPFSSLVAQKKYERENLKYAKLKFDTKKECKPGIDDFSQEIFELFDLHQSTTALKRVDAYRSQNGHCEMTEYLYVFALWQSGQILESQAANDAALKELGPHQRLIHIRGFLSLMAADYGVARVEVDGMSKYLPESQQLPFPPEQYIKANLENAAYDFEYTVENLEVNSQVILTLAETYRKLGKYNKSTAVYERLLDDPAVALEARMGVIKNAYSMKDYRKAEEGLLALLEEDPHSRSYLGGLADLYRKMGNKEKAESYAKQGDFFGWVGSKSTLAYSDAAYDRLHFFSFDESHPIEEKNAALKEIDALPNAESTAYLIAILNMHSNHGNGIESKATSMLGKKGADAVQPLIDFLENPSSTCGMGNAAFALAALKDERAWQPMVEVLPALERLGSLTTLPQIPAALIMFDKSRALAVLLPWIKQKMERNIAASDQALDGLGDIFMNGIMYGPLDVYANEELSLAAQKADFSEAQITALLEEVDGFRKVRAEKANEGED